MFKSIFLSISYTEIYIILWIALGLYIFMIFMQILLMHIDKMYHDFSYT